jgi:hypothetical protein
MKKIGRILQSSSQIGIILNAIKDGFSYKNLEATSSNGQKKRTRF